MLTRFIYGPDIKDQRNYVFGLFVYNCKVGQYFWTIVDRDFIFGMHT